MLVRPLNQQDIDDWISLRARLWPDEFVAELADDARRALASNPPLTVFVAEVAGRRVGFIELGLRSYAEGCLSSPVPHVEGWYVEPDHRRRGVGEALMTAAETWCREAGYKELGSDTLVDNTLGLAAHAAVGFQAVERLWVFRKDL